MRARSESGRVATRAQGYHGPVTGEPAGGRREADDATRGSAIKLAAEVAVAPARLRHDVAPAARARAAARARRLGVRHPRRALGLRAAPRGGSASSGCRPSPREPSWRARSRSSPSSGRGRRSPSWWRGSRSPGAWPSTGRPSPCSWPGSRSPGWGEFFGVALRCRGARRRGRRWCCSSCGAGPWWPRVSPSPPGARLDGGRGGSRRLAPPGPCPRRLAGFGGAPPRPGRRARVAGRGPHASPSPWPCTACSCC